MPNAWHKISAHLADEKTEAQRGDVNLGHVTSGSDKAMPKVANPPNAEQALYILPGLLPKATQWDRCYYSSHVTDEEPKLTGAK